MKIFKKSLIALLVLGSVFVLTSCGQKKRLESKSTQPKISKVSKIKKPNLNQLNSNQKNAYQQFQKYFNSHKDNTFKGATFNSKQNTEEIYLTPQYLKEYQSLRISAKKLNKKTMKQRAKNKGKVNKTNAVKSLALVKIAMKLSKPIHNLMLTHQSITKSSKDKGLKIEIANDKRGFPKAQINRHILTPQQIKKNNQKLAKALKKHPQNN